jgi:uncharacterized integral membrane protein
VTDPQGPPPYGSQPQQYQPVPPGPTTGPQPTGPQPTGPQPTGPQPTAPPPPAAPSGQPRYGFDDKGHVKRTKISGVWIGLIAAAILLILLIIFIAQNQNKVGLHFLGFDGRVSLGLALLVAAIGGVLVAAVPGSIRILQLRKALRRNVDHGTANQP